MTRYKIEEDDWTYTDEILIPLNSLDHLQIGDHVLDAAGEERVVLAVMGDVIGFSGWNEHGWWSFGHWRTVHEIKSGGWKLVGQEEEVIELTIDDIAELKGVDASKIRIKD